MSKGTAQWSMLALVGVLAFVLGGAALAASAAGPTITSVSPASGARGTTVVVQGANLQQAAVTWTGARNPGSQGSTLGGNEGRADPGDGQPGRNPGHLLGAGRRRQLERDHGPGRDERASPSRRLKGRSARSSTSTSINKLGLKPVITELMPKHAAAGTQVTIFGHHFSGTTLVKLAGMNATFRIPSDSRIVVRVPMHAHSGSWTVKTAYGAAVSGPHFTVTASST